MSRLKVLGIILASTCTVLGKLPSEQSFIDSVCTSLGPFKPEVSGYLKHESFFDSRQVVAYGDGEDLLWPENKLPDPCCTDINAQSQFNMVTIETRLDLRWCGPLIGKSKSSFVIEGDFFGPSDPLSLLSIVNIIQLRLAFVQLEWDHTKIVAGHTYHPLTIPDCYPDTVSNNSGSPFNPDSRCTQIRFTYTQAPCSVMLVAAMQLNYQSTGPIGSSTTYEQNSLVPNVHAQVSFRAEPYLCGCAADYKLLKPQLSTDTNYKTTTTIGSWATSAYFTYQSETVSCNTMLLYGQNMTDLTMLGGYAVHMIEPITDLVNYTTLDIISWWAEFIYTKKSWEPGIFVGICKNLGAPKSIHPELPDTIYSLGPDIDIIMRISPRIRWSCTETFVVGVEAEYTSAAYGTTQKNGTVTDTDPVGNIRFLAALYYNF